MSGVLFYLILLVSSLSSEILESSNSGGTVLVKTEENTPHFALVTFSKYFFPHLKDLSSIIHSIYKVEDESILVAFYSDKANSIKIKYSKIIKKCIDLEFKIERGVIFHPVILITKNSVSCSKPSMDIFPTPDFSMAFISFSTCGSAFGMFFNIFLNKSARTSSIIRSRRIF